MQETQVRSLGWEDPLEEGMSQENPHGRGAWWATQSMDGVAELDTTEQLTQVGLSLGLGEKLGTCRHGSHTGFQVGLWVPS